MSIRKEPSGRYRAVIKNQGEYLAGKTFDTRRQAEAWQRRQLALIADGADPRAATTPVAELVPEWIAHRKASVAKKTAWTDESQINWIPVSVLRLKVGQVTPGTVANLLAVAAKKGHARSSLLRYRAVLSGFFSWCIANGYITKNPATGIRIPSIAKPTEEMRPYNRDELESRLEVWRSLNEEAANQAAFLTATGLRWSEARALTVADIQLVPYPAVLVTKAQPEGVEVESTKNGKPRRVPIAADVLPWVKQRMADKDSTDYLMPERWTSNFKRRLHWAETAQGRRIHDLRHTAITLWLADGVDVATVRAWAGHRDLTTTSRYVHWLGSDSDKAALDKINQARARYGNADQRKEDAR